MCNAIEPRALEALTPEGVREALASGRVREDRFIMADADGNEWDAYTGEKLPPPGPAPRRRLAETEKDHP